MSESVELQIRKNSSSRSTHASQVNVVQSLFSSDTNAYPDTTASEGHSHEDEVRFHAGFASMDRCSMAFILLLFLVWVWHFIWLWQFGLVFFLYLTPLIYLYMWWDGNKQWCSLNFTLKSYAFGFVCLATVGWTISFILFRMWRWAAHKLDAEFQRLTWLGQILVFFCVSVYICYVLPGDTLKWVYATQAKKRLPNRYTETKAYLISSTATSLGFATAETWAFILYFHGRHVQVQTSDVDTTWFVAALVLIWFYNIPQHVLTGYLLGLEIQRKTPFCCALFVPILTRGSCLYQLIASFYSINYFAHDNSETKEPMTIWIFCTILMGLVIQACTVWYIKQVETELPPEYLQRMGNLQFFGYGILPIVEGSQDDRIEPIEDEPPD